MSSDDDENSPRRGPLWRHALWVVGVTALGVGVAWADASYRLGSDEYGMPLASEGEVSPYLAAWTAIGLTAAVALRAVAARVPPYCPEVPLLVLTFMGTRLSLAWPPEPAVLAAMAAAALTVTALWCAFALYRGLPNSRERLTGL